MHTQACIPLELCKSQYCCFGVHEGRCHLAKNFLTVNLAADALEVIISVE